jgi:hypothetical protein
MQGKFVSGRLLAGTICTRASVYRKYQRHRPTDAVGWGSGFFRNPSPSLPCVVRSDTRMMDTDDRVLCEQRYVSIVSGANSRPDDGGSKHL